jgi:hypothetical protein
MQNKEKNTDNPNLLSFDLRSPQAHILATIDAKAVIASLQNLHDCNWSLDIYKSAISNIFYYLHESDRSKVPLDTFYIKSDIARLHELSVFLQEITDTKVLTIQGSIGIAVFNNLKSESND